MWQQNLETGMTWLMYHKARNHHPIEDARSKKEIDSPFKALEVMKAAFGEWISLIHTFVFTFKTHCVYNIWPPIYKSISVCCLKLLEVCTNFLQCQYIKLHQCHIFFFIQSPTNLSIYCLKFRYRIHKRAPQDTVARVVYLRPYLIW